MNVTCSGIASGPSFGMKMSKKSSLPIASNSTLALVITVAVLVDRCCSAISYNIQRYLLQHPALSPTTSSAISYNIQRYLLQHPALSPTTSSAISYNIQPYLLQHPALSPTTSSAISYNIQRYLLQHPALSPTTSSDVVVGNRIS